MYEYLYFIERLETIAQDFLGIHNGQECVFIDFPYMILKHNQFPSVHIRE